MIPWVEKYRPTTLDGIVGNPAAVAELRRWADGWVRGRPDKKAVILQGDPGIGKTTAALALGRDMGWAVIEMNASDSRNAEAIERTATRGSVLQTFSPTGEFLQTQEGGRKLIILDEADNVFGREDKGGIAAIVRLIQNTRQPVVLIANDYYALTRRSSSLRRSCRTIKFQRVNRAAMKSLLRDVSRKEDIQVDEDVLDFVIERSQGDLRSAVNDLESLATGRKELHGDATAALGNRDRERTIFTALEEIFRSGDARRARDSVLGLDESPEDLILWVDHNLPYEYGTPGDRVRGFERLSRADIYLGRVRRRQDYGLWSFARELMSAGVATARRDRPRGGQLGFPQYLLQMSRSRGMRMARNSLAKKLGHYLHTSSAVVLNDILPAFKGLFSGDEELRVQMTAMLGLDGKELAYLLDEAEDSHPVKHLLERASRVEGAHKAAESGRSGLANFEETRDED
ncbi:MAG TPA: replication factor C large subunit [Thermoplasmata archaeon]|nr:replication factor C large subunit [Thermoplasmata archaeon]